MSQQYQQKFSNYGSLALAGTIIHEAPANNSSVVKSIRFNNSSSCAITLSHYDSSTATTSVIYTVNLSSGDIMTDTFPFYLEAGDRLIATPTSIGTSFTIEGESGPNLGVRCK